MPILLFANQVVRLTQVMFLTKFQKLKANLASKTFTQQTFDNSNKKSQNFWRQNPLKVTFVKTQGIPELFHQNL